MFVSTTVTVRDRSAEDTLSSFPAHSLAEFNRMTPGIVNMEAAGESIAK